MVAEKGYKKNIIKVNKLKIISILLKLYIPAVGVAAAAAAAVEAVFVAVVEPVLVIEA